MNKIEVLIKDLNTRRESLRGAVSDGSARDYAEYRSMAGEIQGLSLAVSLLTDLVRQMEFEDD